jgi:ribonuclease P protein component
VRLRRRAEFNQAWSKGKKRHTPHFIILALVTDRGATRLGVTVSRKIGGAVRRNKVKRLLREFFRTHYHLLPLHMDLSIIAKKGAADICYFQVCDELRFLTDGSFSG